MVDWSIPHWREWWRKQWVCPSTGSTGGCRQPLDLTSRLDNGIDPVSRTVKQDQFTLTWLPWFHGINLKRASVCSNSCSSCLEKWAVAWWPSDALMLPGVGRNPDLTLALSRNDNGETSASGSHSKTVSKTARQRLLWTNLHVWIVDLKVHFNATCGRHIYTNECIRYWIN